MARAPIPVAAEVVEPVEGVPADLAAEEMAGEEMDQPVVIATILKAADGSYILETGGAPEMADSAAMGATPEAEAPAGTTFTADEAGVGKLMTAILDLVDPENAEGPAAAAAFKEGFGGLPADPSTAA